MIKTSIVIPVKDDDYIFTCLDSLYPQIDKSREVIVVNDLLSSKEFTHKLSRACKKYKVRYFIAEKPGASANRNLGMSMARGKNILFIDSDCRSEFNWVINMEKSLNKYDLIEGAIIYDSKEKSVLDRVVENKETPYRFLTANLGITKKVAKSCSFDNRFIVFREDTDFGFEALEKGFSSSFNKSAVVYHKRAKFTIKRFIFERERYIGEALFFKKHISNKYLVNEIKRIGRVLYPLEFLFILGMLFSLFFSFAIFPIFYFFPGIYYLFKKYKQGFVWDTKEAILVLVLLPITMFIKRIAIWKGACKFKVFVI